MRVKLEFGRHVVLDGALDRTSSRPGAMPVRLPTRKIWVSTACAGWRNHMFSTTFAVLRPTPGSDCSAAREEGTSPP
jgi:hypothetical protein